MIILLHSETIIHVSYIDHRPLVDKNFFCNVVVYTGKKALDHIANLHYIASRRLYAHDLYSVQDWLVLDLWEGLEQGLPGQPLVWMMSQIQLGIWSQLATDKPSAGWTWLWTLFILFCLHTLISYVHLHQPLLYEH